MRVALRERTSRGWVPLVVLGTAILVVTVIPMRGLAQGKLIGDRFDARWTTVIYEHWHLFWTGVHPLRQTGLYWPYPDTLGLSDAFLLPGQVHTILRLMGLDMVHAWAVTNVILLLVCNLGLAVLATLLFKRLWIQAAFVLIAGTNYAFVGQLEHPQTLSFGIITWIVDPVPGRRALV